MSKNRLAMYVFYDKDGIVDRYVIYMLKEMLKAANRLVVICNGELTEEGKQALSELTNDVIIRENEGFDAWAYKAGFEYLGWDNLSQYDELVLFNNSTYGPFYPFQMMFEEMDRRNLDFWGITKYNEHKDLWGNFNGITIPEHISSYFLVIRSNLFLHHEFKHYWCNLPVIKTHLDAVIYYEAQFTKHFAEMGFAWDVYISIGKNLEKYNDAFLVGFIPYELIKNYKLPIIKRKSFSNDYSEIVINTVTDDSARKAFEYIKAYTVYDVEMIWENALREMDIVNVKNNLHLNYILPKNYILNPTTSLGNNKVALLVYITDDNQVEFCVKNASSIIKNADIYIATSSELKNVIQIEFSKVGRKDAEIIVLPDGRNGREVSALWIGLKSYMKKYDFICFMNDKIASNNYFSIAKRDYTYRWLENILASEEYVVNILHTFIDNPRLGMLFPPPATFRALRCPQSNMKWESNFQNTVELAKNLGIKVPIDEKDLIFPEGSMFWFRPAALRKLWDYNWDYNDFPPEPMSEDGTLYHAIMRIYCYAAQSEGYYSAWAMTDSFATAEIASLNHLLCKMHMQYADDLNKELDKQYDLFTNSASWKAAAPLRFFSSLANKIKGT